MLRNLHDGVVISVLDDVAKVKLARHSDCENCGSCPGNLAIVYDLPVRYNVKPGDRVKIYIPEKNMLRAAFIMFSLPMILVFALILAGIWIAQVVSLSPYTCGSITGAVGIVLGYSIVYRYEKKYAATNVAHIYSLNNK